MNSRVLYNALRNCPSNWKTNSTTPSAEKAMTMPKVDFT